MASIFIVYSLLFAAGDSQSNDSLPVLNITTPVLRCAGRDCQNKDIVCSVGDCFLYCDDPRSCENSTIRGASEDSHIVVNCLADTSCVNTRMLSVPTVIANGSKSLQGAEIYGPATPSLYVWCLHPLACYDADIIGTNSASLSVRCMEHEACLDMTVRCPPGTRGYRSNCEIFGMEGQEADVHTNFNLYTPNGWNDIAFRYYDAFVLSGSMFCGGNDSVFIEGEHECELQYGVWDCVDTSSPCRDQTWLNMDRETFRCDNTSDCSGQELTCSENTGDDWERYNVPSCTLLCVDDGVCRDTVFHCEQEKECNVVCAGDAACEGLTVDYIERSVSQYFFYSMNVVCGRDGDDGACRSANISGAPGLGSNGLQTMNVYVFGRNSLEDANINASAVYGIPLTIQCNFNQSCQGGIINAAVGYGHADLRIQCNGEYDACADLSVYCPQRALCEIAGDSVDRHRSLNLFCVDGWDSIDVSQYNNAQILYTMPVETLPYETEDTTDVPVELSTTEFESTVEFEGLNLNIMFCGDEYEFSCEINDALNCTCPPLTTMSPTRSPLDAGETYSPTTNPTINLPANVTTPAPTDGSQAEKDWFIVGITFIVLFSITFGVLGYFACVIWKADQATAGGYQPTSQNEVELINS